MQDVFTYTYACVRCDRPSNKLVPLCYYCHGRMAPRDAHLRYLRRFRPQKYANLAAFAVRYNAKLEQAKQTGK